jgi:hypothetical protein
VLETILFTCEHSKHLETLNNSQDHNKMLLQTSVLVQHTKSQTNSHVGEVENFDFSETERMKEFSKNGYKTQDLYV